MKLIVIAGALALGAGAVDAAIVDFHLGGAQASGQSSFEYGDDVKLTVSGIRCGVFAGPNSSTCGAEQIDRYSVGIGMNAGRSDDHEVDGFGGNEFIKLAFNPEITLKSVSFTYYSRNDEFALYTWDEDEWDFAGQGDACASNCGPDNTVHTYDFNGTYTGSMFLIGATEYDDDWKLKGVSVSYTPSAVPLPAAGGMLIAGLGGLAAFKRRRKSV